MGIVLAIVFIVGYLCIALEHQLNVDKTASALLTGVACWLVLVYGIEHSAALQEISVGHLSSSSFLFSHLAEHLSEIAGILFFLLGAMTLVELMDAHKAFRVITNRITTSDPVKLLWIICLIAFFLSAVLDNMTTAIIMCALLRRIVKDKHQLWLMGGFVILAANAGGAWSPIGDVTTIMLWIGGQVTSWNIIKSTFLASAASILVPLVIASYFLKKEKLSNEEIVLEGFEKSALTTPFEQKLVFVLGSLSLLFVPLFKVVTGLPPYMGILLVLGFVWIVMEIIHRKKEHEHRRSLSIAVMLQRIDTPTLLFFLGILLAVAALDTSGYLLVVAGMLNDLFGNIYAINTLIGLLSAVIDNVPLVSAAMGMYDLNTYPPDHDFWELLAYCAGTGGSLLIIGSAAGVAAMGMLKINFFWYVKRISLYALLGYFAGIAVYYFQHHSSL